MVFLDLWDSIWDNLSVLINSILRLIFFAVDKIIYKLIIYLYKIFEIFCHVRLVNGDIISDFASRLGVILGVVMVFIVALSFVKLVIDPDKTGELSPQNIIKKVVISIVMLGMSTFVFDTLYEVQKIIVESNIIGKVLLAYSVSDNAESGDDTSNFGGYLAEELFYSFYHMEAFDEGDINGNSTLKKCKYFTSKLRNSIIESGDFSYGDECLNDTVKVEIDGEKRKKFVIDYNYILATAVGIATLYFIYNYCISVGIRMVQLAFLEIIFPMAAVSYVSPSKDTMFSKWYKTYLSTYIDVFIRIAIINFVAFLIGALFQSASQVNGYSFWSSIDVGTGSESWFTRSLITVFMIIALLSFAKKAPNLIKKIMPSMGDSGLSFGIDNDVKKSTGQFLGASAAIGASALATGYLGAKRFGAFGKAVGARTGLSDKIAEQKKKFAGSEFGKSLASAKGKAKAFYNTQGMKDARFIGRSALGAATFPLSGFAKAGSAAYRGFGAGGKTGGFGGISAALKEQARANGKDVAQYKHGNHWYNDLGDNFGEYTGLPTGIHEREDQLRDLTYLLGEVEKDSTYAGLKAQNESYFRQFQRSNPSLTKEQFDSLCQGETINGKTLREFNYVDDFGNTKSFNDADSAGNVFADTVMSSFTEETNAFDASLNAIKHPKDGPTAQSIRLERYEQLHGEFKKAKELKTAKKTMEARVDREKAMHPHHK